MAKLKLGILISGRGSNMEALLKACAGDEFPAEVAVVISNNPDARGLATAAAAGVATAVVNHREYDDRDSFEDALNAALTGAGAELICLAGFMRLLNPGFVNRWQDRIINIHPSLLPAFKGLHIHERVLAAGVRFTGCTVHFVRPQMDDGPIIIQAAVPVLPDDTPETLAARVLTQEHLVYPEAVRMIATGEAAVDGDVVRIKKRVGEAACLTNPLTS